MFFHCTGGKTCDIIKEQNCGILQKKEVSFMRQEPAAFQKEELETLLSLKVKAFLHVRKCEVKNPA